MFANETHATQQLFAAATDGDVTAARAALDAGALVNHFPESPLHRAAHFGHADVVQLLIENQANVNARDKWGRTPLHQAAVWGHAVVVKLLIGRGAELSVTDDEGATPLDLAGKANHLHVVDFLKNAARTHETGAGRPQADARNDIDSKRLMTAAPGKKPVSEAATKRLFDTARFGTAEDAQKALDAGADANAKTDRTPLHIAAENGRGSFAQKLIEHGADVNAPDLFQRTPLHLAAANGKSDIIQRLIAQGAIIDARDERKRTPLHWAAHEGHYLATRILIERGADIKAKDRYDRTPHDVACQYGSADILELLENAAK